MLTEVLEDESATAAAAAAFIASEAHAAVSRRGRFVIALSGGRTPRRMLAALAGGDAPWEAITVTQVDERVAPDGDPARNLGQIREILVDDGPLLDEQIRPMPVTAPDLSVACRRYQRQLEELVGSPAVLDLVHLGIGSDGHTASLVSDDPVLDVSDADFGVTGPYRGHRRMTLTLPAINRARRILWLVTGREKAEILARLRSGDTTIPAGRVTAAGAIVFADAAASR